MSEFSGFPKAAVKFYKDLSKNNTKEWFEAHRDDFENHVMEPSRQFVTAMGRRLREIAPRVVADPRVNQSIFKIHRDIRFSKDKTPFKTNVAFLWWEGKFKKLENSSFYFHLEPSFLLIGLGIYQFPKPHLEAFRESVENGKHGAELAKAIETVRSNGYEVSGQNFKKVPHGFSVDHPHADLLRYDGLTVGLESKIPDELYSPALVDFCFEHYKKMLPIHQWLVAMTERMPD